MPEERMGYFRLLYETGIEFSEEDLLAAIVPLMKLLCLAVIGLILAHPKTKIIPKETFSLLCKLVFALFLPCLIFTELGQSITLESLTQWWFIPVNVLLSTAIGCALGYLVVALCHPPPEFNRLTLVMTAFGNTGNLALAVVGSVCHTADNPFGPNCHSSGVTYVSLAQWVSVILAYTLVYHMMKPPPECNVVLDEGIEIEEERADNDLGRPLLAEAEWPSIEGKETEHSVTSFIPRILNSISITPQTTSTDIESSGGGDCTDNPKPNDIELAGDNRTNSPKSTEFLAGPRVLRRLSHLAEQTPIQHILQPPTISFLAAIIIGLIPPLKSLFFDYNAPLSVVKDSLEILARATVPSVMLILGGLLAECSNTSTLGHRTTIGIITARLLVLPVLGIGMVLLADKLNFLVSGDQMYRFVLLLQYTTPSAILLGALASLGGYAIREVSALLFWQHIFALFSLSVYVVIYFKLVSYV
ncbi:protein PIN-LIKES 2-like isoform X1 [Cucurbita maxima]|uniref:Protein PIN-LIKES 2-like isoform X1 n=1 Tax=Cucurbita maxima TaxID=3661 RepID=A0A6J1HUV6_CUCMA|nr:protein PIN-LIKES 2-like isoform X1 [Cucurbita maxima]XP_022968441.1 protein PIN-LIKES 2-like isoform X1 [Cucurbita maxima]